MFKKILIANRGEIACRVAATARRLGVQTVAVYSDADAQAKHVAACDEALHIGGSAPKESYLQWQRIIAAAQATGAQAIHPGYGFLSENEEFAQACADAGLVFIGPPASAIAAMGLKAESKRLMDQAGVPLVPGYHGANQDAALLQAEADRIGYPVLIKASAGGGGKGMRAVERTEDFAEALASCKREATNSFGDDAVLIEKYVQRPRHIEIQVFADSHGHCVYLHERDCSVQRRHQKVLEEAPAPGMSEHLRKRMGEAAVAAAQAVGYVGAGTVEFIVEQTGYDQPDSMRFFFMEMNTRLQVEHPVTEAITGLDLVEWQLRVASGEPLPLSQENIPLRGHAIEARICAENPDKQFLPATGTLQVYAKPQSTSFAVGAVRIDDGVRQGDAISPFYDSMVAKLIVHGDTREQALARLDAALAELHIVGLNTNVQFLRHVLATESFAQARLDTALITREAPQLFEQERLGASLAAATVVAHVLAAEQQLAGDDPFSARDGWHSHGLRQRRFEFEFAGQPLRASLSYGRAGALQLALGDAPAQALGFEPRGDDLLVSCGGPAVRTRLYWQGEQAHIFTPRGATRIQLIDPLAQAGQGAHEGGRLTAPMPGKIIGFLVKAGQKVSKGQALAVMEAMKMEHTIAAPADGEVGELLYAPGDQVAEGAELLKMVG
ncbi:MAG: acetyl/propionyl/methylcrotonyl-CoA carboxylase subunit alpha [Betaproteobacteria bacterium]